MATKGQTTDNAPLYGLYNVANSVWLPDCQTGYPFLTTDADKAFTLANDYNNRDDVMRWEARRV